MSWVKLDDCFPDHRKIMSVGPLAGWLHICGLCYCARLLTDGFIPRAQLRKLADVDDPHTLAELLVRHGLWESAEGGYQIHDYLQFNPSKADVEMTRSVRAEAGRLGGLKSGRTRSANTKQNASDLLDSKPKQKRTPTRSRSRPQPESDPDPGPAQTDTASLRTWPYDEPPAASEPMHALWRLESLGGLIAPTTAGMKRELQAIKEHLATGNEEQIVKFFSFRLQKDPEWAAPSKWRSDFAISLAKHRAAQNGHFETPKSSGADGAYSDRLVEMGILEPD